MKRRSDLSRRRIKVPQALIEAVLSQDKVDEAPHNFYKYPARFSPLFAREAISAFTQQGETVLDPFCGGGTSLIEAMSLGRKCAGFDISSLAVFLTRAKTTPLSVHDKRDIMNWVAQLESLKLPAKRISVDVHAEDIHYIRNLPDSARCFFETVLDWLRFLPKHKQQKFVRLVLLAVGQWALDCKITTPPWSMLQNHFCEQLRVLLEQHYHFLGRAAAANNLARCRITRMRRVINRSSEYSDEDGRIPSEWLPAKLILTSPPYPGVHVLYHRWQIYGRRETPAPFWLASARDGAGESHYCLGRRDEPNLLMYFERLKRAFSAVRGLVGKGSIVVQLVAFSNPKWQLPEYLRKMEEAGFAELSPECKGKYLVDGRIWRQVPGRRWYATRKDLMTSSQEVLLLHAPDF